MDGSGIRWKPSWTFPCNKHKHNHHKKTANPHPCFPTTTVLSVYGLPQQRIVLLVALLLQKMNGDDVPCMDVRHHPHIIPLIRTRRRWNTMSGQHLPMPPNCGTIFVKRRTCHWNSWGGRLLLLVVVPKQQTPLRKQRLVLLLLLYPPHLYDDLVIL